MRKIILLTL